MPSRNIVAELLSTESVNIVIEKPSEVSTEYLVTIRQAIRDQADNKAKEIRKAASEMSDPLDSLCLFKLGAIKDMREYAITIEGLSHSIQTMMDQISLLKHTFNAIPKTYPYYTNRAQVGDIIEIPESSVTKESKLRDLVWELSRYLVVRTAYEGGGGISGNDSYPDGHQIIISKLIKGAKFDPDAKVKGYYQSGGFTAMKPIVRVVGHLSMNFS